MTPAAVAPHERMPLYQRSVDAAVVAEHIAGSIAARRPDLADQLRRASSSVPLNIAEGAGEFRPGEKARFYRMARRSATECMAILHLIRRIALDARADSLRGEMNEMAALLTCLILAMEKRR